MGSLGLIKTRVVLTVISSRTLASVGDSESTTTTERPAVATLLPMMNSELFFCAKVGVNPAGILAPLAMTPLESMAFTLGPMITLKLLP